MDANLILRDGSTNLTADETKTSVKVGPTGQPLWLHMDIPQQLAEANDTLRIVGEMCTEAASTTAVWWFERTIIRTATPCHVAIPFVATNAENFLQVKLDVYDADSGADFDAGAVKVWIASANRYTK